MGEEQRLWIFKQFWLNARKENAMKQVIPGVVCGGRKVERMGTSPQGCSVERIDDGKARVALERLVDGDAAEGGSEVDRLAVVVEREAVDAGGNRAQQTFTVLEERLPSGVGAVPFEQAEFGTVGGRQLAIAKNDRELVDSREAGCEQALHRQFGRRLQITNVFAAARAQDHARCFDVGLGRGRGDGDGRVDFEETGAVEVASDRPHRLHAALHAFEMGHGAAGGYGEPNAHGQGGVGRHTRLILLAGTLSALAPSMARAGGYWPLDRGPSNYARGGANIVAPDDPIALYTNPSALAGLRGLQLHVDGNIVIDNRAYTRAPDTLGGRDKTYPTATSSWPVFPPSPGIFVAYNFGAWGVPQLSIAGGGYGPPRADRRYDADGPQRYGEIESHNLQIHYALGAAYELPWYRLRLGVTGMVINQIINAHLKLNAPLIENPDNPENPAYDIAILANAREDGILAATFGASMTPIPRVSLSLAYQLPYDANMPGTADITLGEDFEGLATVEGNGVDVKLTLPSIFRAAARYDDPERVYDVELAFVREGWSRYKSVVFDPDNIQVVPAPGLGEPIDIQTIDIRSLLRNAYSVRLGGSYVLFPDLFRIRAGTYYETSAVRPRRLNVGAFDANKFGVTLGGRVDAPYGLWLDFAGGFEKWQTQTVDDSVVKLENPLYPEIEKHPIANGTYENARIFVMAALGAELPF